MNERIEGIVVSEPRFADEGRKRITFILFDEETKRELSCVSDLHFDISIPIKKRDRLILIGDWQTGYFRFHTALRSNREIQLSH